MFKKKTITSIFRLKQVHIIFSKIFDVQHEISELKGTEIKVD